MLKKISSLILALALLLSLSSSLANGQVIGIVENVIENNVNIRSGPGTSFSIIDSAPPASKFECVGEDNGWYIINIDVDKVGYISKKLTRFTEAQIESQPFSFSVPVYLKSTDGTVLKSYNAQLDIGENTISPTFHPNGFKLISQGSVLVQCSNTGRPFPASVLFLYVKDSSSNQPDQAINENGNFPVYYKDLNGSVIATEYITLKSGMQRVNANSAMLPSGYRLIGNTSLPVYVDASMKATPKQIEFIAVADSNALPTHIVEIEYKTTKGLLLNTETRTLKQGYHTISPDEAFVPAGYKLYRRDGVKMDVVQSPVRLVFICIEDRNADFVTIPVYYKTTSGELLYKLSANVAPGKGTVVARDGFTPGYILQSPRTVTVSVQNGIASPASVVFTYRKLAQAKVNIVYKDISNNVLYNEARMLMEGRHNVSPRSSFVPNGYKLSGSANQKVTVNSKGKANPATIEFVYIPPITATISLHYRDSDGNEYAKDTRTVYYGNNTVKANKAYLPSGYKFAGETSFGVTVDAAGAPSVSNITVLIEKGSGGSSGGSSVPPSSPNTLPIHQKARLKGDYIVYTGPGTNYLRADGKARVVNGVCRWYGYDGSYVLMGYENSKGAYRIGYIDAAGTPEGLNLQNLSFANEKVTLISEARVTDDPIIKVAELFRLPAGAEVTFLGYLPNSKWAYIETQYSGQPVRGFINKSHIGK